MPTAVEQVRGIVDGLIGQGKIDASQRDQYLSMLAGDDAKAQLFSSMLLMGSDYTRKTQAVAEERRKLEAENLKLQSSWQAKRQELEVWEAQAKQELARANTLMSKDVPELTAKVAAYEQALRDYDLMDRVQVPTFTPDNKSANMDYINNQKPSTNLGEATPSTLNSSYLGREEALTAMRQLVDLTGDSMMIAARHQELFGRPLDSNIVKDAMASGQDLNTYWRMRYNVEAREAEVAQKKREDEIARIREEERSKILAEFSSNPSLASSPGMGTPRPLAVFETYNPSKAMDSNQAKAPEMVPDLASHNSRVGDALSYFRQHFDSEGNPRQGGGPTGSF